jgi:hypothetical protein
MSFDVHCPVCGEQILLAGGEDTDAVEIVMRRNEGDVGIEIRFTAAHMHDAHLHTCVESDYRPTQVPWRDNEDFPVREHIARHQSDSLPDTAHRVETYAHAIERAASDAWTSDIERQTGMQPPTNRQPASVEVLRATEELLLRAFDLIRPA